MKAVLMLVPQMGSEHVCAAGIALPPPSVSEDEALGNILLNASRRRSARSASSATSFSTSIAGAASAAPSPLAHRNHSLTLPSGAHAYAAAPAHVQHAQGTRPHAPRSLRISPRRSDDFTTTAPAKLINACMQDSMTASLALSSDISDIAEVSQEIIRRCSTRNIWASAGTPSAILSSMPSPFPSNSAYFSAEDSAQCIAHSMPGSASNEDSSEASSPHCTGVLDGLHDDEGKYQRYDHAGHPLRVPGVASEKVHIPELAGVGVREHDAQFLLDSGSGELRVLSPPKSMSPDGVSAMQRMGVVPGASGEQEFHDAEGSSSPGLLQPESMPGGEHIGTGLLDDWKGTGAVSPARIVDSLPVQACVACVTAQLACNCA